MVQLGPQPGFAFVGLTGTGLGIIEDVVQLSPHSGFAPEKVGIISIEIGGGITLAGLQVVLPRINQIF